MGLVRDFGSRIMLHGTSRMWGESTAFLLVVGLAAGCTSRPAPPPLEPTAASETEKTTVATLQATPEWLPGEVSSTSNADGHTHLRIALLPELQEGDVIHLIADERVVATALIMGMDATYATALVTGLTDRTRLVAVGDIATRLIPEEVLPATFTAPSPAAEMTSAVVAPGIIESAPAPSEHPPAEIAAVGAPVSQASPPHAVQTPALTPAPPSPVTGEGLTPEVRARLNAERAYFDLATRVLRLPAAGPELTELQNRLRSELAELEMLP